MRWNSVPKRAPFWRTRATAFRRRCCSAPAATRRCAATRSRAWACQQGDATVGGRYYALASIEATHYFTPVWGLAAFVDAGNANDDLASFRPAYGYGAGLRVRSPIGPVRVDIAYGQQTAQVRLHMSVGLSF